MKLLAINGSHRGSKGFTAKCIETFFYGAAAAGAQCKVIHLSERNVSDCLGCQACHTQNHYLKCIHEDKDDVLQIFQEMREADVILYATPVYIFSMSAQMKRFLDRINSTGDSAQFRLSKSGLFFHHIDHTLCSKPFVTLVCCDNIGNETVANVKHYFKMFSRFMDAPQVGSIAIKSAKTAGATGAENNPRIQAVLRALQAAGAELARSGKVSALTQRKACSSVLPIPPVIAFLLRFRFFRKLIQPVLSTKIKELTAKTSA